MSMERKLFGHGRSNPCFRDCHATRHVIGLSPRYQTRNEFMPLTFVYVIGIALSGILAIMAPHYRVLSFVMTAIFSLQIIPVGILEAFSASRSR